MDPNRLLGALLALTGVADLAFARMLAARLAPPARMMLTIFGIAFVALGGALLSGLLRVA